MRLWVVILSLFTSSRRRKDMMRKTLFGLTAVVAAVMVLAACATKNGGQADRITLPASAVTRTVEHKGTGYGIDQLPQWIAEYLDRGVPGVEDLGDYKGKYCIVAEEQGPALQQLLTWVNNFNAQQQIGATINTRVASVFKANESLVPDNVDSKRAYSNAINTLITATYTGARKEADWWLKQVISDKGAPDETRYRAIALYSIDRKILDSQIATKLEELKEGNPELGAAFNAVSAEILERGLEW
jgi:predicted small secreted protein